MIRQPNIAVRRFVIKVDKEKLMLFFYINVWMIAFVTARIGVFASNSDFVSGILTQMILGCIIWYWLMDKSIKPVTVLIPLLTSLLFIISVVLYPSRAGYLLSWDGGIWDVLSVSGGIMGFFIILNLKNKESFQKIIRISMFFQIPYYLFVCVRAQRVGSMITQIRGQTVENSYFMETGYGMSFVAVTLVYLYYKERKLYLIALSVVFEFMILLFGSRAAMLPVVMYCVLWFLLTKSKGLRGHGKKFLILSALTVVLIYLVKNIRILAIRLNEFIFNNLNYYSRTLSRFISGDVNVSSRTELWQPLIKQLNENAFFPLGLYADREIVGTYSHNFIIEIVSNFGVFGIIALAILIFQSIRFFKACSDKSEKMFATIFLSYSLCRLTFSSSFWTIRCFWIYLALLYNGIRNANYQRVVVSNCCIKSSLNKGKYNG